MAIAGRLKKYALIATSPLWAPVALVVLVTEAHFFPGEWRLRRRMKAANRWIDKRAFRATPPAGGMLILELPTFSWGQSRLWWTPDDVLALAPCPPPTSAKKDLSLDDFQWHAFDRWVYTTYLDPDHGRAMLLSVWHSGGLQDIKKRYPGRSVITCFSGGRDLEAHLNAMKAIPEK